MGGDSLYGDLARWYDPLYEAVGKDYVAEADALLDLATELGVEVGSVLDVACGTGAHLQRFAERVDDVLGVDISPGMIAIARERLGDAVVRHGDMRRFDLGRTFDLVTCLFSSIGHVRDEGDLDAAIERMAAHVAPGGVLFVEPWLTPDGVDPAAEEPGGFRDLDTAVTDDGIVSRVSRATRRGDVLVVEFAWAVASTDGVDTARESFRMPLFTRDRYLEAVRRAGLDPEWRDPEGLTVDRHLLVGRRS
jgi:SAM-dependent methyltransferase